MSGTVTVDALVIGAGIAGLSLAAELARTHRVAVLESEAQPGYHATGRSAAVFSESYGGPAIRALSRASRAFFFDPPEGFCDAPLLTPRGCLHVARADQLGSFERFLQRADLPATARPLTPGEARRRSPLLRPDYVAAALFDPGECDIDVHALLHGYLRLLRQRGSRLATRAQAVRIERANGLWQVHAADAAVWRAPLLINAAGAWADQIADMAGAATIGLSPRRRTALLIDAPAASSPASSGLASWPLTIDIDEQFYFKPDAGRLLLSPADETPASAADALPEDWDVAVAVERFEAATTLAVQRIHSRWAGLRSFVGDRIPVVGPAGDAPGFFWYAAQGGYGLQIAPALARLAAALVRGEPAPADIEAAGLRPADLRPQRLQG